MPTDLVTQCPLCYTRALGYLSDRILLLMTLPTSTLKIHIPILNNIPPPKSCPRRILNRPVRQGIPGQGIGTMIPTS